MTSSLPAENKWYRQPYVWLVIIFPAMAVIGGIITAWLAVSTDDGLVADDYYKRGLEINKTLDREQAAKSYGLEALVTLDKNKKIVQVTLRGNDHFRNPESVSLTFLHPTRGGLDRHVILRRVSGVSYESDLPDLPADHWYLQFEADNWLLMQTLYTRGH
jgi:hypothetical protein